MEGSFRTFDKKTISLPSGKLVVREFVRRDVKAFNKILNEPEVNKFLLVSPPVTLKSTYAHFEKVLKNKLVKWVAVELEGILVGAIEWKRQRLKMGHVCGFNIIFSKHSHGTGAAAAAFNAFIPYLKRNGIEIISEDCFADNERARAFYRKLGFSEPVVLKRRFKRGGKYVDEVLIEKFL